MIALGDHETSFSVRKATFEDGKAIVDCLQAAFEQYRSRYTPEAFSDTVLDSTTIQPRLSDMCIFVAVSQGKIVGTIGCSANGPEGHLRGMAGSPERQGSGIAAALLEAAEHELAKKGCKYVTLDTTEPLTRAIHFYQKHGFSPSERVSDFFGMKLYEYQKAL